MSLQNSKQISDVKVLLKMGSDGSGIASIEKTGTSGIVDTYTITYDNGNKTTFTVTNGNGIVSIAKTGTSGLVDTYTITFQDQTTTTFEVTNGRGISSIEKTATQGLVDTYTITYNDNTTSTFTVTNGEGSTASTLPYNNATSGLSATNVQDAIDEVDGNVDTLQDTKANQTVIATRQTNLVAVKKYEIGEQFIYNNTLYKADAVINQNGTITIGGNASLADDISTQISNIANYSTTETNTGKKWINGKDIYRKVIEFGSLPNNSTKYVRHNISGIQEVINISVISKDTSSSNTTWYSLPYSTQDGLQYTIRIVCNTTDVAIRTGTDRTNLTAVVILEYIK